MGGNTVDEEGSDREQAKQRMALMHLCPLLQKMGTMEPNKCGEVIAAHHLEEKGQIAMGGNAVEGEGSDRE
jgi:hypothetical protein